MSAPTLADAARLVAAGEATPEELVAATLARIDETEPLVHAYAHVARERSLSEARAAAGPLAGAAIGVKDVICTEGMPTECGSRLRAGHVPAEDAECVRRLRAAGAVVVGKHVTYEFACGMDDPPTRNPWELAHYPGGSSAGSGVSVAVGSCHGALGTDAGGSVRKPAALTSTVGLKPTRGLVPRDGVLQPSGSLDHVGTFSRTVEDARLLLEVLAGRPFDASGRVAGSRLGVAPAFLDGRVEDGVRALVEDALRELERLGAEIVPIELPTLPLTLPALFTIITAEGGASLAAEVVRNPGLVHPRTRRMLELGALLPGYWVEAAQRARAAFRDDVRRAFRDARLDALAMPTLPRVSIPMDTMVPGDDLPSFIPFTLPWNLTGQPALSLPCGLTPEGLPAGLQLVGRPFAEDVLLRLGRAFQEETAWHELRPPLVP